MHFGYMPLKGILGSMPNNSRFIEIQLMQRFLRENLCLSAEYPSEYADIFLPLLPQRNTSGSVAETFSTSCITHLQPSQILWTVNSLQDQVDLPNNYSRYTLSSTE